MSDLIVVGDTIVWECEVRMEEEEKKCGLDWLFGGGGRESGQFWSISTQMNIQGTASSQLQ